MSRRKAIATALFVCMGAGVALACGPFFPWQLLDARNETLKATPKNSFAFEAAHLVAAPKDHLKAVEANPYEGPDDTANTLMKADAAGLPKDQARLVQLMREQPDEAQALKMGSGLPQGALHYTAGAVDYHGNRPDLAIAQFQAVLALPDKDKRLRAVWAAYMLGKLDAQAGNASAAQMFQEARRYARDGAPDPLGLAVASYGEEAKIEFVQANSELLPPIVRSGAPAPPAAAGQDQGSNADQGSIPIDPNMTGYTLPPEHDGAYRFELSAAVRLYAEQAARGSDNAVQSLRIISEGIAADPTRMSSAVVEPVVQRLLIAYALARTQDTPPHDSMIPDAGTHEPGFTVNPLLPQLVAAIAAAQTARPAYYDRLAALCYRLGRYDLAEQLAKKGASPLAMWVLAKIATQKGDLKTAEKDYAAAAHGFPQAVLADDLDSDNRALVQGEAGSVALARGEYLNALDTLYPVAATYWGDVAYIAERVLTTDELKNYVDQKVAAVPFSNWGNQDAPAADRLRELLARRLMREGRFDAAHDYFVNDDTRKAAEDYVADLREGGDDWGRVDRAEALFNAAVLAKKSGMQVMGTEADPDYAVYDGNYDTGLGQSDPKGAFVTAEERKRFVASKPKPDLRYHYRYLAVDEVNRAADLLPPRTQAFAAVLCAGTGWMMGTPGEGARVKALYHRYVKQGPSVPWAKTFGRNCAKPDFAGAIYYERVKPLREARHFAGRHKMVVLGIGGILLALIALVALYLFRVLPAVPAIDRAIGRGGPKPGGPEPKNKTPRPKS
jgi:hypothetical protein